MSNANVLRRALLGEYNPSAETHIATEQALLHSSLILDREVVGEWISSELVLPCDSVCAPGPALCGAPPSSSYRISKGLLVKLVLKLWMLYEPQRSYQ